MSKSGLKSYLANFMHKISSGPRRQPAPSYRKTERHYVWQMCAQERNLHWEMSKLAARQSDELSK